MKNQTLLTVPASCESTEVSDNELMAGIQKGDAAALETLYQRYQDLFKSVIVRIVHDHAAAEDILQECLVEVWRSAHHFCATKGQPLAWLVTLCKRRAIDYIRRSTAYCSAKDRLENQMRTMPAVVEDNHDCENSDLGRVLRKHLDQLPEYQRQVVCLAFIEGMSQREVAKATQTPLGTVKTRLELGLKKLRTAFRTQSSMHSLLPA